MFLYNDCVRISHFCPTALINYWIVEGALRSIAASEMQNNCVNRIPFIFRRSVKSFLVFSCEILPFLRKISKKSFSFLKYRFACIRKENLKFYRLLILLGSYKNEKWVKGQKEVTLPKLLFFYLVISKVRHCNCISFISTLYMFCFNRTTFTNFFHNKDY